MNLSELNPWECRLALSFTLPQENAEGNDLYERAEDAPPQTSLMSIRDVLVKVQPQSTLAKRACEDCRITFINNAPLT